MTAAGWFPDPAGIPDRYRWWDGTSWTRYLSTDPQAPAPQLPEPEPEPALDSFAEPTGQPVVRAYPPGYEWVGQLRPRRAERGRRWPQLIAAVAVLAVLAVVAAVVVDTRAERQLGTPPPTDTPSPVRPVADYDDSTRRVQAGSLTLVVPDEPFFSSEMENPGRVLLNGVNSYATVHAKYAGEGTSWVTSISVGFVPETHRGPDLKQTARNLYQAYSKEAYGGAKVQTKKREELSTDDYPHPVRTLTADAHYAIKKLPSDYDDVSVLVVDNEDGTYSALIVSRPNDQPKKLEQAIDATLDSIQITE